MKRFLSLLAGLALMAATSRFAALAIDADPAQKYDVTPAAGAWMICAASYTGPQSAGLAHELVLDIRRNYNLPAFVFNRGDKERRELLERYEAMKKLNPDAHMRTYRIEDQFAVLVGGYKDMESARKALDGFKKLKPTNPALVDKITRQRPAEQNGQKGIMTETVLVNPFQNSFVVRNPTVPVEQVEQDRGPDPLLKQINAGESFTVYKCPKPWTVAVAVFQSPTVIQTQETSSSFLDKLLGTASGERLTAGAMNAHNLAGELRKNPYLRSMNMDAYVFHTRNNSVVCIGAFDRKDDPMLLQMIQRFHLQAGDSRASNVYLSNPLPMEVPH